MPAVVVIDTTQTAVVDNGLNEVVVLQDSTSTAVEIDRGVTVVNNYGGVAFVTNETPTGLVNGINATFTSEFAFDGDTLEVWRNGSKLTVNEDYSITNSTTFVFFTSPITGDNLLINYTKQ